MTNLEYSVRVSRPADVNRAFWLLISSVLVSFTSDTLGNAANVASLVIVVLWNTFWVLLAFKIRAGRNWARITLTVLTTLGILLLLIVATGGFHFQHTSTTTTTSGPAFVTISLNSDGVPNALVTEICWIISTVLALAAIVFIFRPAANAYVRRPR